MRYEVFCDMAYFDQWAVRPVGVSRWGHCYHLPSKEEAEGLAKQLEELEAERDDARDWLGSYKESVAIAAREINTLESKNAKLKMEIEDTERAFIATENSWKKLIKENAKLRDIAKRAIEAFPFTEGYGEFSYAAAVLRAELDQLKEGAK